MLLLSHCNLADAFYRARDERLYDYLTLEEGMATHSSSLAWRIPWTEQPAGLQSMGLKSQTRLKPLTMHARVLTSRSVVNRYLSTLLLTFLIIGLPAPHPHPTPLIVQEGTPSGSIHFTPEEINPLAFCL